LSDSFRVIDDWGKEINGLAQGRVVVEQIHSGVVGCVESDKDTRIVDPRQTAEDLLEKGRVELTRSTSALHGSREADTIRHGVHYVRALGPDAGQSSGVGNSVAQTAL
jgi:hypothetical protein